MLRNVLVLSLFGALLISLNGGAQEPNKKRAFGEVLDNEDIRFLEEEEWKEKVKVARERLRPVPKCELNATDQIQIFASSGSSQFFVQLKKNSRGTLVGTGASFRLSFAGDVQGKDIAHYHCEAVRGWLPYTRQSAIVCVGAFHKVKSDFAGRGDFHYPSAFFMGPCESEKERETESLCYSTNVGVSGTPSLPERGSESENHPLVKMYSNKRIDFSALIPPASYIFPFDEDTLSVRGATDWLTEPNAAEAATQAPAEAEASLVPMKGWAKIGKGKTGKGKLVTDSTVNSIFDHYHQTCGWLGFTAARPEGNGPIYIAFGQGGMGLNEGPIPEAIKQHRAVAKYIPSERRFEIVFHLDSDLNGSKYDYKDFICEIMCYRRLQSDEITNPLGCD